MPTSLIVVICAWIACGVGTAGITFAYFQDSYPTIAKQTRRQDLAFSCFLGGLFGPIGLVISFFLSGFAEHGWRLR